MAGYNDLFDFTQFADVWRTWTQDTSVVYRAQMGPVASCEAKYRRCPDQKLPRVVQAIHVVAVTGGRGGHTWQANWEFFESF